MIDAIEQEISVYGETQELEDSVIDLSLRYEIRCIYTAYFADYETIWTSVDPIYGMPVDDPKSFIGSNYPNPFYGSTTIRFYIDEMDAEKLKIMRIYNLQGNLIAVLDISHYAKGWHEIRFDGQDMSGKDLPAGIYLVQMQINNQVSNTIRINLVR